MQVLTSQVATLKEALAVEHGTRIAITTSLTELVTRLRLARRHMADSENARYSLSLEVQTAQINMQRMKAHIQGDSQLIKSVSALLIQHMPPK